MTKKSVSPIDTNSTNKSVGANGYVDNIEHSPLSRVVQFFDDSSIEPDIESSLEKPPTPFAQSKADVDFSKEQMVSLGFVGDGTKDSNNNRYYFIYTSYNYHSNNYY